MGRNERALAAAEALAAAGTPAFPCSWWSKGPTKPEKHGGRGYKDATIVIAELRALWRDFPGGLVGTPCGQHRDFILPDLLDLDFSKHPESREWFEANKHRIPRTRIYWSRSGGLHLLFQHDDRARNENRGRIARGVDVKTTGGYRIDWPSAGFEVLCDGPLAAWPQWLLRAQQPPPPPIRPVRCAGTGNVEALARFASRIQEGNRNAGTHWAACRVWERGGDTSELHAIAQAAMQNGLSRTEAERVVFKQARKSVKGS
jgi:hypothetical protein